MLGLAALVWALGELAGRLDPEPPEARFVRSITSIRGFNDRLSVCGPPILTIANFGASTLVARWNGKHANSHARAA